MILVFCFRFRVFFLSILKVSAVLVFCFGFRVFFCFVFFLLLLVYALLVITSFTVDPPATNAARSPVAVTAVI